MTEQIRLHIERQREDKDAGGVCREFGITPMDAAMAEEYGAGGNQSFARGWQIDAIRGTVMTGTKTKISLWLRGQRK